MRSMICYVPLMILTTIAGTVGAQEGFDPAARAAAIAPFIDEQTFAVFHVEPARIDVDRIANLLVDLMPELSRHSEETAKQTVGRFRQLRAAFLKSGFTDLYIVASQADYEGPFFVIPNPEGHDPKEWIAAWLNVTEGKGDFNDTARFKEAVVVGNPEKLQRLTKAFRPETRAELAEAFRAAGDTAIQFILYPSADQRRVLEETMPKLPRALGGGPMTILTRGMLWAAVGFDAPPDPSLRVVVRSEDARAAAALRRTLVETTTHMVQPDGVPAWLHERLTMSQAKQAIALLTPQVKGDRLELTLDGQDGRIQALLDSVKPPAEKARRL